MKRIQYKSGWVYHGPKKDQPKWCKSNRKKAIAQHFEAHRAQYPAYWSRTQEPKPKCKHPRDAHTIIKGKWGPHGAKRICVQCDAHIKWEKSA